MTKPNTTRIGIILDESGSMASVATATVAAVNAFVEEQKKAAGDVATISLTKFNSSVSLGKPAKLESWVPMEYRSPLLGDAVPMAQIAMVVVSPFSTEDVPVASHLYNPKGGTALLDAIGITVTEIGKELAALPEEERPSDVIIVIQTDGEENASSQYTGAMVKAMVEHQQAAYSWRFVFLGANIDAAAVGKRMGILRSYAKSYTSTSEGTSAAIGSLASSVRSYRETKDVSCLVQDGSTPVGTASAPAIDLNLKVT